MIDDRYSPKRRGKFKLKDEACLKRGVNYTMTNDFPEKSQGILPPYLI